MSNQSLATRIFLIVLSSNIAVLLTLLISSYIALEKLEITFLESTKSAELSYFEKYIDKTQPLRIHTHETLAIFRPTAMAASMPLPILFENLPIPFEGEVETIAGEYLVFTHPTSEGVYFYAKNLEHFEKQETLVINFMKWLSLALLSLSLLLAFVASRLIAAPIEKIAAAIKKLTPEKMQLSIPGYFIDKELVTIVALLNESLERIDQAVKRERSLIALASHELRTPIAIILGAANIIERRNQLLPNDKITMQRMIKSANDMSAIIETLLNLVRQVKLAENNERIDLNELLDDILEAYQLQKNREVHRVSIIKNSNETHVTTNRILIKLLIQNILNNALDHTTGAVTIELFNDRIAFSDEGIVINNSLQKPITSTGLGLFIVSMICEHLHWHFEVRSIDNIGTLVTVYFYSPATTHPLGAYCDA